MEFVKPSSDVDRQIEMDLDQNEDQSDPQGEAAPATMLQTPADGVAPESTAKKLTMAERLDRIPKYRIRSTTLRNIMEPSGRGGKAEVARATFKRNKRTRGKRVAVKKLLWSDTANKENKEKFSKEFVHEVELLAKLSHENIVQLIGFVEDLKDKKAWIVLSWEPNGNVREFLASGKWEIPERISLIQDMFNGLKYLHTQKPPVCHGDLKSLNILVSSSYRAIITDFGSARRVPNRLESKPINNTSEEVSPVPATATGTNETRPGRAESEVTVIASTNQLTLTGPAWSLRWAAPEVVMEDESRGLASDIWSAGWVCWEMMTDKIPFEELTHEIPITLRVVQGTVPLIHEDAQVAQVVARCSLMKDCWRFKPECRPYATQCCREVEWMPSVPPLGGAASHSKDRSPELLLQMAILCYEHGRNEEAARLLEQVLANAESAGGQDVATALKRLGDVCRAQCRDTRAEECYTRAQELYARIGDDQGRANTLDGLGDVYRAQCRYMETEASYTRALEIYTRIDDDQGRANTILGLGHVYRAQCRYTQAEESYRRAQEIYTRIGDGQGRANTILGLGRVYRAHCKYTEAEECYKRAQEIYARIGNDLGRANTILGLADVYCVECRYTEAEESYTRAQEIYARTGNDQGRANTMLGLGDVYRAQCRYTETEELYICAIEIYARIGDDQGRANTILGLGDLYRAQCRYTEAEEFYTRAQEIYARIGDDRGRANTIWGLGDVHRVQCRYTAAEESYTRALGIYAGIGNDQGQANTILGLGDLYRAQCRYTEAEESYSRAQEIYARMGDDYGRANTVDGLGEAYRAQCKYTEAEESYTRAQEIYACIGNDLGRANTLDELGDLYRAQCKYTEAEESYTRAQEIYASISDILGRANTLCGLGHLKREQARCREAAQFYAEARHLYSQVGNSEAEDDASYWLSTMSNDQEPSRIFLPSS